MNFEKVESYIKSIIEEIGEDPDREGLKRTPVRVAKAYKYLTSGYTKDIDKIINDAIFEEEYNEMVIVKDVDFYSMCEHHLLPFYGKIHVAYIPKGKVVGLSKIPKVIEVFARRLQIQERMTQQIANTLDEYLKPSGVGVVVEAYHMCMMMRGVEKQNSYTLTSTMLGVFKDDSRTRGEFLDLISHKRI